MRPVFELLSLEGRVALITGAGSGLGRAFSLALAGAGADCALLGRREGPLLETANGVKSMGRKGIPLTADVRDSCVVEEALARALEAFGRIDILMNNAGVTIRKPVVEMEDEEWERVIDTNLTGYFRLARAVGRVMIRQRSGSIINIASVRARATAPGQSAYASTKGAIISFTKALALEMVPYGVRVNAIAPGYFETQMTAFIKKDYPQAYQRLLERIPSGRWGKPEELTGAAIFLASEASSYITGQTIYLDGGELAQ
ncbi:MAG: SDR family NAD(P)-dependent oxidoreductase [Nitrospinota bacterium]